MRPRSVRYLFVFLVVGTASAQPHRSANDDLSHHTARFAPLFANAQTCVPRSKELTLALDVYDGKVVACAQALTRQAGSVFLNMVSFGCWDVDVATGKLALRADKGRSHFACQDGCPGEEGFFGGTISYNGARVAMFDDTTMTVFERKTDGSHGRMIATVSPVPEALDAMAVYLGGFLLTAGGAYDDGGRHVAKLPQGDIRVLDEGRAVIVKGKRATVFALASKEMQLFRLADAYTSGPIALGEHAYALKGRTLSILDSRFGRQRTVALATCK